MQQLIDAGKDPDEQDPVSFASRWSWWGSGGLDWGIHDWGHKLGSMIGSHDWG